MAVKAKAVPADDLERLKSFEFQGETYYLRERFKVGRFLKLVTKEPVDALELVLSEDSFEKFLDLEISMEELELFMDAFSNVMVGKPSKN